ncbi:MAG: Asp-tRNA(Asn)/Glu-tRNA(Gln) amidotransferase subunit GatC [Deltaproteobacteria bacterium]|nr:Asp-tRNA(Asn)/Glu-tRNA(Gln) amidotransferase subunit GatC [Deltaproteobacteria bacterium]
MDLAEVERIAHLARLALAEHELPGLARDLAAILTYVDKLKELDTTGVEPTTHAVELATKFRDDVVQAGLPVELGLGNAPERIGDGFGVPKIIE